LDRKPGYGVGRDAFDQAGARLSMYGVSMRVSVPGMCMASAGPFSPRSKKMKRRGRLIR
jgi:hypothetical protein